MERLEYHFRSAGLSPEMNEFHIDEHARLMSMHVKGFVWAENLRGDPISYPADWWEAFKERWFPAVLLKRWPVKRTTHRVDFKVLYPDYRAITEDQRFVVHQVSAPNYTPSWEHYET